MNIKQKGLNKKIILSTIVVGLLGSNLYANFNQDQGIHTPTPISNIEPVKDEYSVNYNSVNKGETGTIPKLSRTQNDTSTKSAIPVIKPSSEYNQNLLEMFEVLNTQKLEYEKKQREIEEELKQKDKSYIIEQNKLEVMKLRIEMDLKKAQKDLIAIDSSTAEAKEKKQTELEELRTEVRIQLSMLKDKYASINDDVTIFGNFGFYKFGDKERFMIPINYINEAKSKLEDFIDQKNKLTESIIHYQTLIDTIDNPDVMKANIRLKKTETFADKPILLKSESNQFIEVYDGMIINNLMILKVSESSFTAKIIE